VQNTSYHADSSIIQCIISLEHYKWHNWLYHLTNLKDWTSDHNLYGTVRAIYLSSNTNEVAWMQWSNYPTISNNWYHHVTAVQISGDILRCPSSKLCLFTSQVKQSRPYILISTTYHPLRLPASVHMLSCQFSSPAVQAYETTLLTVQPVGMQWTLSLVKEEILYIDCNAIVLAC
jgi:hypothetical protein